MFVIFVNVTQAQGPVSLCKIGNWSTLVKLALPSVAVCAKELTRWALQLIKSGFINTILITIPYIKTPDPAYHLIIEPSLAESDVLGQEIVESAVLWGRGK